MATVLLTRESPHLMCPKSSACRYISDYQMKSGHSTTRRKLLHHTYK